MMRNSYQVGIAGMKIARSPDQLCAIGLGSCVGVALYDPAARIGGL
ncbi:MAG TPA: chemotaxis protein CheD, partial [Clostridiales bacterium]|nr:chemotaxis protein CheD [Clostridiales bacterium]